MAFVALACIPMEIGVWWQQVQPGNHTNTLFVSKSCHLQHVKKEKESSLYWPCKTSHYFQQDWKSFNQLRPDPSLVGSLIRTDQGPVALTRVLGFVTISPVPEWVHEASLSAPIVVITEERCVFLRQTKSVWCEGQHDLCYCSFWHKILINWWSMMLLPVLVFLSYLGRLYLGSGLISPSLFRNLRALLDQDQNFGSMNSTQENEEVTNNSLTILLFSDSWEPWNVKFVLRKVLEEIPCGQ